MESKPENKQQAANRHHVRQTNTQRISHVQATSILGVIYAALSVIGMVLLVLSADTDNTTDVVIGTGAVILGVLGVEAQSIITSIEKSRGGRQ